MHRKVTPAVYLRMVLHKTKRLSPGESPRIDLVPCPNHELCGTVENIEVQMNSNHPGSLGYTVRRIREDVSKILRNDLMRNFEIPASFCRDVLSFPDKLSQRDPGYFFGEGDHAKRCLRSWSESFARHLSKGTSALIGSEGRGNDIVWSPTRQASDWLKKVDQLSVMLYILVHLCGGGPPRVTEMVEAKLRNTAGGRRNLFIIKQRLAFIVSYSKTSRQAQKPKPTARFLDEITSELLLLFVVFIKPVQCFFLKKSVLEVRATEDYIFCQSGEKVSDHVICREFSKALSSRGLPLNVRLYRQLRTGIAKAFLAENLNLTNEQLLFAQAGHSESTARKRYAGGDFGVDELSIAKLEGFYNISRRWHEIIGIVEPTRGYQSEHSLTRPLIAINRRGTVLTSGDTEVLRRDAELQISTKSRFPNNNSLKRRVFTAQKASSQSKRARQDGSEQTIHARGDHSMTTSILRCASDILGLPPSDTVNFKSEAQRAATFECSLQTIVTGYNSTMIVILPTGGGKTLCWATATLREQRSYGLEKKKVPITLLILPLISLQQDMLRKCQSSGLRCGLWEERFRNDITVVICSIDVVLTNDYERFVMALSAQGRLARFILDEAHLTLLWEDLRRFHLLGSRLRPSQASFVPLVCLSATLPNNMVSELQRILQLDGSCVKLYKTFNNRENISYQVRRVEANRAEKMIDACHSILMKEMERMLPVERFIVFCLTIKDCVLMYNEFLKRNPGNIACIYHGSMDHEERRASFNRWVDTTSKIPIAMMATSAFSCGIDYPHVRAVIHAGGSRTIVELAQESGRAGRDGAPSKNIIVFDPEYVKYRKDESCFTPKGSGLRTNLGDINKVLNQEKNCRRQVIESFLNDFERGPCQNTELKCDVCEASMVQQSFLDDEYHVDQEPHVETAVVVNRKRVGLYPKRPFPNDDADCSDVHQFGKKSGVSDHANPSLILTMQLVRYVQSHDQHMMWYAHQISLAKCAVCFFNRNRTRDHGSCMRARCFRCLEAKAAHQSKECKVTPRGNNTKKRCFFCGIPRRKNLHTIATYDKRDQCEWEVPKNLALLIWRDARRRMELVRRIPLLQRAKNMEEVVYVLCGGSEDEEVFLTHAVEYMYSTFVLGTEYVT